MLSIRAITRSAPRAASRLTSSIMRRPISKVTLLQTAFKPVKSQFAAAFSTSMPQREKESQVDDELVAKFESELEIEEKLTENDGVSSNITDFLESGQFEIEDIPGREEVVLTRKFGDENIRVSFSILDLNNMEPEADYDDRALDEEEMDSENANVERNKTFKASLEDSMDEGDEAREGGSDSFAARAHVVIEKPGKGALAIDTITQDGIITVEQVYFYPDASSAVAKTAQAAHERQELYVGPPFGNLDEDLQLLFDKYLDERGINTALAVFVPDYIEMKEQKEYMRWLSNVKKFIDA